MNTAMRNKLALLLAACSAACLYGPRMGEADSVDSYSRAGWAAPATEFPPRAAPEQARAGRAGGPINLGAELGHVDILPVVPRLPTQVINRSTFHVQQNRFAMSAPGNSTNFDVSLDGAGCLRGSIGAALAEFCPASLARGDKPGSARWRSTSSVSTFAVQLSPDQNTLLVEAGRAHGVFALGQGGAIDQLRRHPEMLGLAFVAGLMPAAKGHGNGPDIDFGFEVVERLVASAAGGPSHG